MTDITKNGQKNNPYEFVRCYGDEAEAYILTHTDKPTLEKYLEFSSDCERTMEKTDESDWKRYVHFWSSRNHSHAEVKIRYKNTAGEIRDFVGLFEHAQDAAEDVLVIGGFKRSLIDFKEKVEQKTVPALFVKLMFYYMFDNGIPGVFEEQFKHYKEDAIKECIELALSLSYIKPNPAPDRRFPFVLTPRLQEYVDRILNTPFYNTDIACSAL